MNGVKVKQLIRVTRVISYPLIIPSTTYNFIGETWFDEKYSHAINSKLFSDKRTLTHCKL